MPQPGKCWRHGIIGTHGSWLPGSPKGWRSRGHKIHSSGDYKKPPPSDEHLGLYRYSQEQCPQALVIPKGLRPIVAEAFRDQLLAFNHRVLAIALSGMHCHFLAELPTDKVAMQAAVGDAKRKSSRAVKKELPGRVWAAGGKFILIADHSYQKRVFDYIRRHANEGAWVWTCFDA